jgi:hypothetical protein
VSPPSSVPRISQATNQREARSKQSEGGEMFLRNVGCFNDPHGLITQKINIFISTTLMITSKIFQAGCVGYLKSYYIKKNARA